MPKRKGKVEVNLSSFIPKINQGRKILFYIWIASALAQPRILSYTKITGCLWPSRTTSIKASKIGKRIISNFGKIFVNCNIFFFKKILSTHHFFQLSCIDGDFFLGFLLLFVCIGSSNSFPILGNPWHPTMYIWIKIFSIEGFSS